MARQLNLINDVLTNGHVIEASAGTGKTYSVAALMTRELARREDLRISDVLITTFTRNAAAELRDRIRRRIVDTASALRRHLESGVTTPLTSGDETVVALSSDVAELPHYVRRLERAAVEFDSATISTIHAVCHRIMTMAGVGGRLPESEDGSRQMIAELVNDELVSRAMVPNAPVFDEKKVVDVVAACLDSPMSELWFSEIDVNGEEISPSQREMLESLKSMVSRVLEEMHVRTANNPTFNDQVRQAERILATDEYANVRARIADRYTLAFVDEAQDTDELQWRLFHHIFPVTGSADARTLVAVGDPKQAIYSFRGADVHSYLGARDPRNMSTLAVNFRSDEPLIESLNALFDGATFGADITYQSVVASEGRDTSAVRGIEPCEILDIGDITNKNNIADAVVTRVLHLLGSVVLNEGGRERPLEPQDICVLTETNAASTQIQRRLARFGVPAVSSGAESVFSGELATEVRILLHALERIADVGRVRRVATSSFFGYSMTDPRLFPQSMVEYVDPADATDLVVELQTLLLQWKEALTSNGVAGLQMAILGNELVAKNLMSGAFGERNLTDFSHIFEALLGQVPGRSVTISDVIVIFDALAALDKNAEVVRRRVESDRDAVTIMTTHGAKGLEFPVVIVAQLWKERKYNSAKVPKYYRAREDNPSQTRSVIDIGWAVGLMGSDSASHVAAAENEEQRRVLYVAMTRAQHHVTLCVPTGDDAAPIVHATLNSTMFGSRLPGGVHFPMVSLEDLPAPIPYSRDSGEKVPELLLAPAPTAVRQTYIRTSFSGLTDLYKRNTSDRHRGFESITGGADEAFGLLVTRSHYASDDTPLGVPHMPLARVRGGTYIGKVIHEIYEQIDFTVQNLEEDIRRITEKFLSDGSNGQLCSRVADGVHRSLTTPLGPNFQRRTIAGMPPAPQMQELRFEMSAELLHAGVKVSDLGQVLVDMLPSQDPLSSYAHELADDSFDIPIAGLVNGSVDAVLNVGSDTEPKLFITDWKSNRLDSDTDVALIDAYAPTRLISAMEHHHYPLQALLYGVAMFRYLRWRAPHVDADASIKGMSYFFIRGMLGPDTPRDENDEPYGVFTWTAPPGLWKRLSNVLAGVRS